MHAGLHMDYSSRPTARGPRVLVASAPRHLVFFDLLSRRIVAFRQEAGDVLGMSPEVAGVIQLAGARVLLAHGVPPQPEKDFKVHVSLNLDASSVAGETPQESAERAIAMITELSAKLGAPDAFQGVRAVLLGCAARAACAASAPPGFACDPRP